MADMTIDEATRDASVSGNEIIPISDGGLPKSATAEAFKDFVLEKIAELPAAGGVDASSDSVYILRSGVMRRVSASVLASAIMDYAFGLAGISGISGNFS